MLNNSSTLPRFYSRLPVQLLFFPDAAFCSFQLWSYHQLLFPAHVFVFHFSVIVFFKMGGNRSGYRDVPRPASGTHIFICWPHTKLLFLTHNFTSKSRFHKKRSAYHALSFLTLLFARNSFTASHPIRISLINSKHNYFLRRTRPLVKSQHTPNFCLQE